MTWLVGSRTQEQNLPLKHPSGQKDFQYPLVQWLQQAGKWGSKETSLRTDPVYGYRLEHWGGRQDACVKIWVTFSESFNLFKPQPSRKCNTASDVHDPAGAIRHVCRCCSGASWCHPPPGRAGATPLHCCSLLCPRWAASPPRSLCCLPWAPSSTLAIPITFLLSLTSLQQP